MQRLSLILHNDDNEYRALNIILSQEYFQTVIQNVHLIRNGILPSILFWLNAQIHQAETNDHHFAGYVSKLILYENHYNMIRILPEVISNIPYINNPSMVQIMFWYQTSFNPLSEPIYCNSEEPWVLNASGKYRAIIIGHDNAENTYRRKCHYRQDMVADMYIKGTMQHISLYNCRIC